MKALSAALAAIVLAIALPANVLAQSPDITVHTLDLQPAHWGPAAISADIEIARSATPESGESASR